jgi:hypothetical protein
MFNCYICNYNATTVGNLKLHCKSKNHINNEQSVLYCVLCKKKYKTIDSYKTHKYKSHNNMNTNKTQKDIIYTNKNSDNNISKDISNNDLNNNIINNKLDEIKEEIQNSKKEVVTVVNKAITKASSLIKYLMENHRSVPPLKKIKKSDCIDRLRIDYNCPEQEDIYSLQKIFVRDYTNNMFIKNLAKSILNLANYKDKNIQPIYNTDCTRYNYVVKTSTEVWNEDKSGIKFTDCIIRPLLRYIRELNEEYIEALDNINMRKNTFAENEKIVLLKDSTYNLDIALTNDYFIKPLLKELSPYLRFLKDELEEMEKLEELVKIQDDLQEIIDNNNDSIGNSYYDYKSESETDSDYNDNYIKKIKVRLL